MAKYSVWRSNNDGSWDLNNYSTDGDAILQRVRTGLLMLQNTYEYNLDSGIDLRNVVNRKISNVIQDIQKIVLGVSGVTNLNIPLQYITIKDNILEMQLQIETEFNALHNLSVQF